MLDEINTWNLTNFIDRKLYYTISHYAVKEHVRNFLQSG